MQILGRLARKFWNWLKNRNEGATFIDTVIYNGSHDPEEDKKLRNTALRKAVLAKSILKDAIVYAEHSKPENWSPQNRIAFPSLFDSDPDVEEYSTLENVETIYSEISRLRRKDYVELTDEFKAELQKKVKAVGGFSVVRDAIASEVDGINRKTVYAIVFSPQKAAPKYQVDAILDAVERLPKKRKQTPEERKTILSEIDRTGVKAKKLHSHMLDIPEGLKVNTIDRIYDDPEYIVEASFIEKIIATYSKLRFLTPEEREHFGKLNSVYGINAKNLFEEFQNVKDYGYDYDISLSEIQRMLDGTKEILREEAISTLMDLGPVKRPFYKNEKSQLRELRKESGAGLGTISSLLNPPFTCLNKSRLNRIFNRQAADKGSHLRAIKHVLTELSQQQGHNSNPEANL